MARVATVNFYEQVDGDTFINKEFRFFDADGTTPLDLTDVTPRMQIRKDSAQGRLYRTLTVGDGITWVNQATGKFQIGGFDIDWGGAGDYYYDIQFNYATSGYTRTYIKGVIGVIDDTTADA